MWYIFNEPRPQKDWHELESSEGDPVVINDTVIKALENVFDRYEENKALQAEAERARLTETTTNGEDDEPL